MQLEIITPESKVFAGEVTAVQFPGLDGLFQVLNGHAPIISSLQKGTVKVDLANDFISNDDTNKLIQIGTDKKTISIDIKGGVVEMSNNKITLLAE